MVKLKAGEKMNDPENREKSAEDLAREMLSRIGVSDAEQYSAGDLVELANLIAQFYRPVSRSLGDRLRHPIASVSYGDLKTMREAADRIDMIEGCSMFKAHMELRKRIEELEESERCWYDRYATLWNQVLSKQVEFSDGLSDIFTRWAKEVDEMYSNVNRR